MLANEYFTQLVDNKLVFSVRAMSREEIPVPAILIDSGEVMNPFGFVEKHRNDVSPTDFDQNGERKSDQSSDLRKQALTFQIFNC